jgi:quinolinate synthase
MVTADALQRKKEENPKAVVVCYVNSSAEVKALSDICCTSANAAKVVESIPAEREIIFIPDKWLGDYVSRVSGRRMLLWNGHCPTHVVILAEGILALKKRYPDAEVLVHPECPRDVVDVADHAFGTMGMINHIKTSPRKDFIIGTEIGILHRLRKENPERRFHPASILAECPNMKLINLEKILWSLEDMRYEIDVKEDVRIRAEEAVLKMLEIGK